MTWSVDFIPEAKKDMTRLGGSLRQRVIKSLYKVAQNPLPQSEGGFGKPLGNKAGTNLTGLYKIKLRGSGIRVTYALRREHERMLVIVVGVREDNSVYKLASMRAKKHLQRN